LLSAIASVVIFRLVDSYYIQNSTLSWARCWLIGVVNRGGFNLTITWRSCRCSLAELTVRALAVQLAPSLQLLTYQMQLSRASSSLILTYQIQHSCASSSIVFQASKHVSLVAAMWVSLFAAIQLSQQTISNQ